MDAETRMALEIVLRRIGSMTLMGDQLRALQRVYEWLAAQEGIQRPAGIQVAVGDVRAMAQELDESWLAEAAAAAQRTLTALAALPDDAVLAAIHEALQ